MKKISHYGKDKYGSWFSFTICGIKHKLRWIEPGEFLMGSPKNEPKRADDEFQHKVILTRGYWIGETACTQELWQAVMGNNPSYCKGSLLLPVESVLWDDCIEFIKAINKIHPHLNLRMPTEAEWEYACRAGTLTPFSFGNKISTNQVNYNGNYPYAEDKKGEYRAKTVEVKTLPCNSWGLYEMHGNVWEWCADWFGEYSRKTGIDPTGPKEGTAHVLRGGSWIDHARFVRSAFRDYYDPDFRDDAPDIRNGFRLARN